jgi:hypothetical protein
MRFAVLFGCISMAVSAQNPYAVAPSHYHLIFENAWARATRVTYGPHEQAPVHDHPSTPTTVYIYVTDGGVMRFHHITGEHVAGFTIDRPAVKAGAIRFTHGAPETHSVEYLGDSPTEYIRIELRTEPLERAMRDVRLPPVSLDTSKAAVETEFENAQVRILRVMCTPGQGCPAPTEPDDPAIEVTLTGPLPGQVRWLPEWSPPPAQGPLELVRIELKTKPVGAP